MHIIPYYEFEKNQKYYIDQALNGKVFVYPTDTIYGIGALFPEKLQLIYKIKKRPLNKKVSVILPDRDWFEKILNIDKGRLDILKKFVKEKIWGKNRGFTFIGKMKKNFFLQLPKFTQKVYKDMTLGVRILNHPFQNFVKNLNKPFITTSANISGNPNIKNITQLQIDLISQIDYIIDYGTLFKPPSILIKFENNTPKIIPR